MFADGCHTDQSNVWTIKGLRTFVCQDVRDMGLFCIRPYMHSCVLGEVSQGAPTPVVLEDSKEPSVGVPVVSAAMACYWCKTIAQLDQRWATADDRGCMVFVPVLARPNQSALWREPQDGLAQVGAPATISDVWCAAQVV